MAAISLVGVTKRWGDFVGVDDQSLEIADQEFLVLLGPSGCGKTTTMRMIAGLEEPSGGDILIGGRRVNDDLPKDRDIAMVFQNYGLYPHMTVGRNIGYPLKVRGVPKEEIPGRVRAAAEQVELLDFLERKPKALSGGQRQRVALARAIVRTPQVFLMDEPLSNLDAKLRVTMRAELKNLSHRLRVTTVYVTHDQIEAMTMADRIVILSEGVVQQVGTPREVYNHPVNRFVAGFIGSPAMNFLDVDVTREDGGLVVTGEGFRLPVPGRLAERFAPAIGKPAVAGLRPEHFIAPGVRSTESATELAPVQLEVTVAEYIGSSQFLAASIAGTPITAAVAAEIDAGAMTSGEYLFDTSRLYLFDRESGLTY